MREEIAQPELGELPRAQVSVEIEDAAEVVRADLDPRLADLERRFRNRMRPLFDDENMERGILAKKLPGETEAGEASAQDDDIPHGAHQRGRLARPCGRAA